MRWAWLRHTVALAVLLGGAAGCGPLYHVVRASPAGTWRSAHVITVQPVDWSAVRIDGAPHAAFAAQLAEARRPLLYDDMARAGEALRAALIAAEEHPRLRTGGDGPQLRLEVLSWERGYWASVASNPTVLRVRGTLERTAGSSEDVAEFWLIVHHTAAVSYPQAGLFAASEQIARRILDWLAASARR